MQFFNSNDDKVLYQKLHSKYNLSKSNKDNNIENSNFIWIVSISIIAFILSLVLSLFSEIFLNTSNLFLAFFIIILFMALNIFSDMIGLAITSCQVTKVKKSNIKQKEKAMCLLLIKNSDKVSSILCDVIGDACGILCGAGGSILAIILSNKASLSAIFLGVLVSSSVVCLTVLLKAITKKYAIKNSLKIVRKCSKILLKIKK